MILGLIHRLIVAFECESCHRQSDVFGAAACSISQTVVISSISRAQRSPSVQFPSRPLYDLSTLHMCVAGILVLQQAGHQGAPPSKHPGAARRSRGLNTPTPGSSPLLCDWEHGASEWEKHKSCKSATAKKSAACPNPSRMRRKERRKESADKPDCYD